MCVLTRCEHVVKCSLMQLPKERLHCQSKDRADEDKDLEKVNKNYSECEFRPVRKSFG